MAQGSGPTEPILVPETFPSHGALRVRRPLVGVACAFVAGMAAGGAVPIPVLPMTLIGLLLLLLAVRGSGRAWATVCLWGAVALAGVLHERVGGDRGSPREVGMMVRRAREHVSLIGMVVGEPVAAPAREAGSEIRKFTVRVEGLRRAESWQRARGRADVWWLAPAGGRSPAYGERWLLSGVVGEGVDGTGYAMRVDGDGGRWLSGGHGSRLVSLCRAARQRGLRTLERGIEDYPDSVAMLEALLLGYRRDMSPRLYRAFSTTGTLHIVAVSGLHVGVVVVMAVALLKMMGWPRPRWVFFLAPALVAYTIITGASPSAVRACVMAMLIWVGPALLRRPDGLTALAAAALGILAFAPEQLREPGFIFSFAAVAALMTLYAPMMRPVQRLLAPDPWRVQPERRWVRWARSVAGYLASLLVASLAAWIVTAPITARWFNLVSPVSLLANLAVIPLSFVILFSGSASLVVGSWWPLAAEVLNHASRVFIDLMLACVDASARVPGGYRFVRAPSPEELAAWYGLMVLVLVARGWTRRVLACGAVLGVGVMVWLGWHDRGATVHVLDVGQGSAVLVNVPGGRDILVDAGPRRMGRRVVKYLHAQGVDRLAALVLTHGDADHVGGAVAVLDAVPVDEMWCAPFLCGSKVTREVLREAGARGVRVRRLVRGDGGALGAWAEWEVLHPSGDAPSRTSNGSSLVLRVGSGATAALLMGGGDGDVERVLLGQPVDVAASLLVVGDHAARGTCLPEWLEAVTPARAVVSVGVDNMDGHPDGGALRRLEACGVEVSRTDRDGDVVMELGVDRTEVSRPRRVPRATSESPDRS